MSPTWRAATIGVAQLLSRWARPLIVPMTLDRTLLDELRDALTKRRCRVHHVCLVASLPTVHARLAQRDLARATDEETWVHAKAAFACIEHATAGFEPRIDTERKSPDEIADAVLRHLRSAGR